MFTRVESAHAKLKKQLGSSQGSFESSWTRIHGLIELQHSSVKASLEKSLLVVQHNFKPAEFKELRGFISISALNHVLAQSKRANSVGFDDSNCGCAIRRTHGIPCAHQIARYRVEGRPIPLDCIDPHWRKLDILPTPPVQPIQLSCDAELDLIALRFKKLDGASQLQMIKKLREIASPDSTPLLEPAKRKTGSRGRASLKVDTSTRRDPSAFELVLSGQDSYSPGVEKVTIRNPSTQIQKRRPKQKVSTKYLFPYNRYHNVYGTVRAVPVCDVPIRDMSGRAVPRCADTGHVGTCRAEMCRYGMCRAEMCRYGMCRAEMCRYGTCRYVPCRDVPIRDMSGRAVPCRYGMC